jgi:hypothetical protein
MWIASAPSSSSYSLFQRQRAFVGGQRLVFEGLELGRDVALGVLQGLPAAVVVGHLFGVGVGDLDVEAMHLVVLDLEVGDAAAFALARFELDQEGAAVVLDGAQLVELGVVARRDDAAVAQQRGGFGGDGVGQQATQACGVASAASSSTSRVAVSPAPSLRELLNGSRRGGPGCRAARKDRAAGRSSARCGR